MRTITNSCWKVFGVTAGHETHEGKTGLFYFSFKSIKCPVCNGFNCSLWVSSHLENLDQLNLEDSFKKY